MDKLKVFLLADDHEMVRAGFRKLIEMNYPESPIYEAGNHADVVKIFRTGIKINVVLLDINMGNGSATDTIAQLRLYDPDVRILPVSTFGEDQYAIRMIQAGANGYISKSSSPKEFLLAIKRVLDGKKYISGNLAEILADYATHPIQDLRPESMLSNREYEVFCLIGSGKSVSDIATILNLSVKTISTYRANILSKTALKNNAEIMFYALKNKLLPDIS